MTTKYNITYRGGKNRDRIVDYLAKNPGATSLDIAVELGISEGLSSSTMNSMLNAGIVSRRRRGKYYAYMLKAESKEPLDLAPYLRTTGPDVSELESKLAELQAKVNELAEFKAEALAKHPDLSPIDYEAYRPALDAFYVTSGASYSSSTPIDDTDMETIRGLIAAAKLMPA